jgi:asparagine synthase (glutamine-hydrolysing)
MFRAKTTFEGMARNSVEAYFHRVDPARADARPAVQPGFRASSAATTRRRSSRHAMPAAGTDDPLALIQYLDLKTYLVGDINTKVDRASMAHSLEVREPLMDHELVEWLATLPPRTSRSAARKASSCSRRRWSRMLPHDILYRPKMGFAVPLARWFRGPLRSACATRCSARAWRRPAGSTEDYLRHWSMPTSRQRSDCTAPFCAVDAC